MPITLRAIADPTTETVLLPVLRAILLGTPAPNTNLALQSPSQTGAELVYLNDKGALALSTTTFPALHLGTALTRRQRNSLSTYSGQTTVRVDYYDDWQQTTRPLDQVWADVSVDLYRMLSNLESNDTLTVGGVTYSAALTPYTVLDYAGHEFDTTTVPGRSLVVRTALLPFTILPYSTA